MIGSDVRFWPKADIDDAPHADMPLCGAHVR